MDLIHGYIYRTVEDEREKRPDTFLQRNRRKLGIILSITVHVSLLAWFFYTGVIRPLTNVTVIDEAYDEVKWLEYSELMKPLQYPAQLLPQPGGVMTLEEIERHRKELEEREREARRRRQQEEEAERNPKAETEEQAKEEDKPAEPDQPEPAEEVAIEDDLSMPAAKPGEPAFGIINARPIREIIGKVYSVYKNGELDIENAIFTITLGFEVKEDGSLDQVRIINSSGSQHIDTSAMNIANALSASHALMPLATLSANTATLELTAERASLKIVGNADTTVAAADLAGVFSQQLAGLQLLMNFRNPDVATLLSHLKVTNEGNKLIAHLTMSRADASAMMRKNFSNSVQPVSEKQPDAMNMNHKTGQISAAF